MRSENDESASPTIVLDAGAPIRSFTEDMEGNVWIGTLGKGMYRYRSGDGGIEVMKAGTPGALDLANDRITAALRDTKGRLWTGYDDGGLSLFSPFAQARHYRNDEDSSLSHDTVLSILQDREGNIWVGTWSGLNRLSPHFEAITLYTSSPRPDHLPAAAVVALQEDKDDLIWLGTLDGHVIFFERERDRFEYSRRVGKRGGRCGAGIFDISEDRNGTLWFASLGDGICALNRARTTVKQYKRDTTNSPLLGDNNVLSLLIHTNEKIYAGNRYQGLNILDPRFGDVITHRSSTDEHDLPSDYIWPLIEDTTGSVWLGAFEGGIVRFDDSTDRFTTYPLDGGAILSNRIYDLAFDREGFLWAATDDGVRRFDRRDGSTVAYTTADGLAQDQVRGIVEDDLGDLWFTTNDGLSRFTPATGTFKNFNVNDGLQADQFYARSVLKSRDGRVWFGGPEGFNIIDPSRIRTSTEPPRFVLSEIRVHGEPFRPADNTPLEHLDHLNLRSDQNRFSLSFAVLDYTNVEQNRYRYRLRQERQDFSYLGIPPPGEPGDTAWVDLRNEHIINFPILGYGSFQLDVGGANGDGVWNQRTLPITIETPLWATDWFRALMILAVMGLLFGVVMVRERYHRGLDRFRLKLASGLHDDVGANLATIAMKVGLLLRRMAVSADDRSQLAQLGDLARETGFSVRDTEWIIKSQHDTLDQLVAQLRRQAETMLSGQAAHTFEVTPATVPAQPIHTDLRRNVYLLFKEALNNANKYARASHIAISVNVDRNILALRIEDDGVGFDRATLTRSNGILHMEMRAAEAGGRIAIASAPGEGTAIDLRVPLRVSWWGAWWRSRYRSGDTP
jgi:streptogramin lyase